MGKSKILLQLDSDPHPSSFDAVVAVDAGVDQLLQYGAVSIDDVTGLVHGAMFTRGPQDLHQTAIFIGGSNVTLAEQFLKRATDCFFGPMRVSVMMDASGANTTSAAAVVAARRHVSLRGAKAVVLAATGPVGNRVARLLCGEGADVLVASRSLDRAQHLVESLQSAAEASPAEVGSLRPIAPSDAAEMTRELRDAQIVIAAGAAGVELLPEPVWQACADLRLLIDLNAVPPAGIGGISVTDQAVDRNGVLLYGAIGVGGLKMKIHHAAVQQLFTSNNQVLDIDEIYQLGIELDRG